jgi:hypothetical protein
MDSISDFVRGGKAGCGVQDNAIDTIVTFLEAGGTQLVEIFLWATIGLGDRRAAKSDPPPPLSVTQIA